MFTFRVVRSCLIGACAVALIPFSLRMPEVAAALHAERIAAVSYGRGTLLLQVGRIDEAAAAFRNAIASAPRAAEPYVALADAEFRRRRISAAVSAYRQLLAIYPYSFIGEYYRGVGLIELRGGQPDKAQVDLSQAVELDPDDWLAYHLLGHAYRRGGNVPAARVAWQHVLRLNPDFQPAYEQLRRLDKQPRSP